MTIDPKTYDDPQVGDRIANGDDEYLIKEIGSRRGTPIYLRRCKAGRVSLCQMPRRVFLLAVREKAERIERDVK